MSSIDAAGAMFLLGKIAATSSRNEKERLIESVATDSFMRKVFKFAYDPFITFGITPPHAGGAGSDRLSLDPSSESIWDMLYALAARRLTGNAAAETVRTTLESLDAPSAELLWRILSKDLRCGITAKTIFKMAPGILTIFNVMLSKKYTPKYVKIFPVAVEPKLDGLRAVCMVANDEAKFYSRVGNHFPALDVLGPAIAETVKRAHLWVAAHERPEGSFVALAYEMLGGLHGPTLALEGEALSGLFAETSGAVRRTSEQATDVEYHVFDAVPFAFMTDHSKDVFREEGWRRNEFVRHLLSFAPENSPLRLVPRRFASNHEEIDAIFETNRATLLSDYLARGDADLAAEIRKATGDKTLEGAIVKSREGFYEKKRSASWLKMKAQESADIIVESMFEGNGKYTGQMGGVVCDFNGVKVSVGGGFTDTQRVEYWNNKSAILGRMAEIEYHEQTPDGSMRHPRFLRWRDDKYEKSAA